MPSYGDNFWNVLAYDGQNTYTTNDFRGFYAANDHSVTTMPADTIDGSFEFNTAFDGWKPNSAPSEALTINGAKATYDGCNVRSDSFSVQAKRQGHQMGEQLFARIREHLVKQGLQVSRGTIVNFDLPVSTMVVIASKDKLEARSFTLSNHQQKARE